MNRLQMPDQQQLTYGGGRFTLPGAAAAAPLLCAAHCIATPLLVLFVPMLVFPLAVEYAILVGTLTLATALLWRGFRIHGNRWVALPATLGALLWIGGELTGSHSTPVLILHAVGGILIAAALVWSARLRHEALCGGCGCTAHQDDARSPLSERAPA
jgi:hypothetical protein